ncbi:hypothetical protein [Deinococcus sp.]|uniref:hypothetical protein n=1 Tax=Deinococcus sp. TaxID=47478 RepID=UPI0025F2BBFE|nr:hypothetical protein [Deinococcus sp.]
MTLVAAPAPMVAAKPGQHLLTGFLVRGRVQRLGHPLGPLTAQGHDQMVAA